MNTADWGSVLITGAAGFVGINLTRAFALRGQRVVAFDHRAADDAAVRFLGGHAAAVAWLRGDVRDASQLRAALDAHGVGPVLHTAAVTATTPEWERERARSVIEVNVAGTVAVLESARAAGCRRVVIVSSASALGPGYADGRPIPEAAPGAPTDLYGISKWAMELIAGRLAALYGLEVATVRLSQPYGPMQRPSPDRAALSPIAEWVAAAAASRPLRTPSLDSAKDWIYVEDVAAAFVSLVEAERLRHPMYNLGAGRNVTAGEVFAAICREWPRAETVVTSAPPVNPNLEPARLRGPLEVVRLREEFGFRPRFDIASGIARYAEWVRSGGVPCPSGPIRNPSPSGGVLLILG